MLEPSHATPSSSEGVNRKPYTIDTHVAGPRMTLSNRASVVSNIFNSRGNVVILITCLSVTMVAVVLETLPRQPWSPLDLP